MEELKIKKFNISEVDEITLLSIEEAKKLPDHILCCGDKWWLRSPGYYQYTAINVLNGGDVRETGSTVGDVNIHVRPAFRISNLESENGEPLKIGKTWCIVIDKGLVLADYPVCKHRFDSKSNDWETSELRAFINSDKFKAMI